MFFLMMTMIAISIEKLINMQHIIETVTETKKSLLFSNNGYFELPVKHITLQVLTSAFISHLSPV